MRSQAPRACRESEEDEGQERWCLVPASESLSVCISFALSAGLVPKRLLAWHRNRCHLPEGNVSGTAAFPNSALRSVTLLLFQH